MHPKGKPTTAQLAFALEKKAKIIIKKIGNKNQKHKSFWISSSLIKFL